MNSASVIFHSWTIGRINDGHMKQTSVYDFYVLGEVLSSLSQWKQDTPKNKNRWQARVAYEQLEQATRDDSVLLPASRDAAKRVMGSLESAFGKKIQNPAFGIVDRDSEDESEKMGFDASMIWSAISGFETIFRADLPRMTVFSAEQKGIYRTESLIDNADRHFPTAISKRLPAQAKTDIVLAGKCLAFDVHTASAFHMWRALEIIIGAYYVSITSRTFEDDHVPRNWGTYIDALVKVGADTEITGNLNHIRAAYRNPVMHPNVNVTQDEAFSLFGIGVSAITQVMQAIDTQPHASKALSA